VDVIGIKTKVCTTTCCTNSLRIYAQILQNPCPFTIFSLCIANVLRHPEYQTLLPENSKFFASLATIPISGIMMDGTLDMAGKVPDPNSPDQTMSLWNTFLNQSWCLQNELTQIPRKILLVTANKS